MVAMKKIMVVLSRCCANAHEKRLELGTGRYLKSVSVKTTLARDC
jgi:hypothetical protein